MPLRYALFLALLVTLGSLTAHAQADLLRINEINYTDKWVELFYPASATGTINAAALCLCSRPAYFALSTQTVLSGSTTMNPGDFLVVTWDPATNFDAVEGEVGLYATCAAFANAANMNDYMEYGAAHAGGAGREDVAVTKGIWTAGTFVPLAPAGKSLSFFGGGFGATNWAASEPTLGSPNSPLPVELTAFEAHLDAGDVLLSWQTASETNNAGFEVQTKTGTEGGWQRRGFVEGEGTTRTGQSYRHRVTALPPGRHAFRLKQIDFDGAFSFSAVVEVTLPLPEAVHLSAPFPNPFVQHTQWAVTVSQTQPVQIHVHDLLGRRRATLFDGILTANEARTIRFDAAGLAAGTYLIRILGADFTAGRVITRMP